MTAVLTISGFDPSGRAGILADVEAIGSFGCLSRAAVTLLTVQDQTGVRRIEPVDAALVAEQIRAAFAVGDIGAVKIGALGHAGIVRSVADALSQVFESGRPEVPVVLDPVIVATSGTELLDPEGVTALRELLLPRATVLTPNLDEADKLAGTALLSDSGSATLAAMKTVAKSICTRANAVIITGGHLPGPQITDLLCVGGEFFTQQHERVDAPPVVLRGTGCRLASAIAVGLARGLNLRAAWAQAVVYITARLYI